jgi:hypothetical protein
MKRSNVPAAASAASTSLKVGFSTQYQSGGGSFAKYESGLTIRMIPILLWVPERIVNASHV